jgi:uncharacterized protein YerC
MIKFYIKPFIFSVFVLLSGNLLAQTSPNDSTVSKSVQHAVDLYHKTMGTYAHVFNGTEYIGITTPTQGHPFFSANKFEEGSIVYDGLLYPKVSLLYDLVNDQVIVKHQDNTGLLNQIQVEKNKVSKFDVLGHTFIKLDGKNTSLKPGFYDQLYIDSNVQVLAKRSKYAKMEVVVMTYKDMDSYFILKDGQHHTIKSKASVLRVFKDRKKELSKYLRDNNISFHLDRETAMVSMAAYYNTLNN